MTGDEKFLDAPRRAAMINESLKKTIHEIDQDRKRSKDGFSVETGSVSENYLSGNVYLCIGMVGSKFPVWSHYAEYYAVIKSLQDGSNYETSDQILNGVASEPGKPSVVRCRDKFQMLVNVRQLENGPQVVVPSVVWLFTYHQLNKIGIDPRGIYLPARNETFKAISGWEVDLLNIWNGIGEPSQGDGNLIKRGAQVVDNLGREDVDDLWGCSDDLSFHNFIAGCRIDIFDKGWVTSEPEALFSGIKLHHQSLCPLDFKRRSIKYALSHGGTT